MYKYCATEESVRRQRQLEQCLLKLMLSENYQHITISQICDLAGISRKSFYRYFTGKEGCLFALLDHAVFDGASYYLPDHRHISSTLPIYQRFFQYWKEQDLLLVALSRNSMNLLLVDRMINYIFQEEDEFRIFFRDTLNEAHERSLFYIGGIMTLVLDWQQSGYRKSVIQMAQILSDLIDKHK